MRSCDELVQLPVRVVKMSEGVWVWVEENWLRDYVRSISTPMPTISSKSDQPARPQKRKREDASHTARTHTGVDISPWACRRRRKTRVALKLAINGLLTTTTHVHAFHIESLTPGIACGKRGGEGAAREKGHIPSGPRPHDAHTTGVGFITLAFRTPPFFPTEKPSPKRTQYHVNAFRFLFFHSHCILIPVQIVFLGLRLILVAETRRFLRTDLRSPTNTENREGGACTHKLTGPCPGNHRIFLGL